MRLKNALGGTKDTLDTGDEKIGEFENSNKSYSKRNTEEKDPPHPWLTKHQWAVGNFQ